MQVKSWSGPATHTLNHTCTLKGEIMERRLSTDAFSTTHYFKRIPNWIGKSNIERAAQVAAQCGDAPLLRFIIAKCADPQALLTAKDTAGSTLLHMAVYRQHVEVVKVILELAPDVEALVNTVNHRKASPLEGPQKGSMVSPI